jgi:hypothetical protein
MSTRFGTTVRMRWRKHTDEKGFLSCTRVGESGDLMRPFLARVVSTVFSHALSHSYMFLASLPHSKHALQACVHMNVQLLCAALQARARFVVGPHADPSFPLQPLTYHLGCKKSGPKFGQNTPRAACVTHTAHALSMNWGWTPRSARMRAGPHAALP